MGALFCDESLRVIGTQQEPQQKGIMNWKKFFIAFIAAFVFLFVFGFIWYGNLMHNAHQEVPALFRPEAEFKEHFPWLILGEIVMAFFLTMLCVRFVPAGGAGGGAMLGVFVALVYAGVHVIDFAVMPLTTKILCGWTIGAVIEYAVAGAIIGALYKPGSSATA
jgi:hypothetical protein